MSMENIIIPKSLQIVMDDVGWFNGNDDRKRGGSARTAMPRRHCAEDYTAINELGRRLNMRINCAFVLGEWDPDDRLKSIKWLSKYGDKWNNSAYLDKNEMTKVAKTVRSSPYIDIAVHGLMHNYYNPSIPYCNSDYFYTENGRLRVIPEKELRARLDAFFDILDYYKIEKSVNSFVPPTFSYIWESITDTLCDYGIKYVSTPYENARFEFPKELKKPRSVGVEGGRIITLNRNNNDIPWNELSTCLENYPITSGIFGCHWPNALHLDKNRHSEILSSWIKYFERCSETFGIILSRDIAFAANQSLFEEYTSVQYKSGKMIADISRVPKAMGINKFYLSAKNEIRAYSGCTVSEYERKRDFINYEIIPNEEIIILE